MKQIFGLLFVLICLSACSGDKDFTGEIPVIDVVNSIGNYQKVYCSDLFSSMELIPLETREDCLIGMYGTIKYHDGLFFVRNPAGGGIVSGVLGGGISNLMVFDRSGKFLNSIGRKGQGPEEYIAIGDPFFNPDQSTLFVDDIRKVIEYDYEGNFIRSFGKLRVDSFPLQDYECVKNGVFIASTYYNGQNAFKYCLLDSNGIIIKTFPNYFFYNKENDYRSAMKHALAPIHVDNHLFLKDFINDTIYSISNLDFKPAFVFGFGQYTYPKDHTFNYSNPTLPGNAFFFTQRFGDLVGAPNYFFYRIRIPNNFSGPKSKPVYNSILGADAADDGSVHGVYDIAQHINILLDTEPFHFQKGFINDLNGGLSFIPKYYAGNGVVLDIWNVADMKEMLTEEYFASLKIKDPQAHQQLKELLKTLRDDDNPVVVVAKLK
ncbi:MAG: 6-bladed beta-propeller [Tannerella sp.]|jgi:hypothetical protein|nr:6-bladed beta-propeller [Tannerella sp.]